MPSLGAIDPGLRAHRRPQLAGAAHALWLDAQAADVVALLRASGLPSVLLKGRATADWLYVGESRDYVDIDLLVDPARRDEALEILARAGFRHRLLGADRLEYGTFEVELVDDRSVCIDLHHNLIGVAAGPATCWEVLSFHTEPVTVAGRSVQALDAPARTMHLALHAAQNGWADTKAIADLERGLARLAPRLWEEALVIARRLDAVEAFSGGLQLTPRGRETAAALGLAPPRDVAVLLRIASVPQEALQVQALMAEPTLRGRFRLVARKLWPTAVYMRTLQPPVTGQRRSLIAARLRRARALPPRSARAVRHWLRAREAAAAGVPPALSSVRRDPS